MAKTGRKTESERRCLLTGQTSFKSGMIRMVIGPDGALTPDLAEKLPGRGLWVSADGPALREAQEKGRLNKAIARSLQGRAGRFNIPAGLAAQMESLLERRIADRLGILNRAGLVVVGTDKILTALKQGVEAALLLLAADTGRDSTDRMLHKAGDAVPVMAPFGREFLSAALGRENVVGVLILQDQGIDRLTDDLSRLEGLRGTVFDVQETAPDGALVAEEEDSRA